MARIAFPLSMKDTLSGWLSKPRISPVTFPELPIEIIRLILEGAATNKPTALSLCLVSKDVRLWTIPTLYRTVLLPTPQHLASFEAAVAQSELAMHVRNLFLRSMSVPSGRLAANILSVCTNIQRLVVDALYRQPTVDVTLAWPTPWEVVYIYGATSWLSRGHPSLQNVTHIHLDGVIFSNTVDICLALPRLTHLGVSHVHVAQDNHVYDENFVRLIGRALTIGPFLQMVLIQLQPIGINRILGGHSGGRIWTALSNIPDTRLLACRALEADDYSRTLEDGTSIWDNAAVRFADWRLYPSRTDFAVHASL
ncbi:hypothetical protein M422DRAFT_244702 [Sphaerobolus stellatus SS14]|nr:hypothetical protein M422DRAFT_244702 [Sphaerobolus stellatus SS14]